MNNDYKNKSINEIKGLIEKKPEFGSGLEKNIINAFKKPLVNLTNEELRMFLVQDLYLEIIIPIIFDKLKDNILVKSEDTDILLLNKLLQIESNYWSNNKEIKNEFVDLIRNNSKYIENPKELSELDLNIYKKDELPKLKTLIEEFVKVNKSID